MCNYDDQSQIHKVFTVAKYPRWLLALLMDCRWSYYWGGEGYWILHLYMVIPLRSSECERPAGNASTVEKILKKKKEEIHSLNIPKCGFYLLFCVFQLIMQPAIEQYFTQIEYANVKCIEYPTDNILWQRSSSSLKGCQVEPHTHIEKQRKHMN